MGEESGLENSSSGVKNSSSDGGSSVISSARECWTTAEVSPSSSEAVLFFIGEVFLFLFDGDLDLFFSLSSVVFFGGSVLSLLFLFSRAFF